MPDNENQDQAAGAEDGGAAGAEDGGGEDASSQNHQIRFVARTLDGEEVASAPLSLKPGDSASGQARVAAAYWGHASYQAGDTAYACASSFNADGATIRFTIQVQSGASWSDAASLSARVADDKAVVQWPIPADTAAGTKIKFKAATSLNNMTAIESSVKAAPAPPAGAEDHAAGGEDGGGGGGEDAGGGDAASGGGGGGGNASAGKPAPAAGKPAPGAAKPAPTASRKPAPAAAKPAPHAGKAAPHAAKPAPHAGKAAPQKPAPSAAKPAPRKPAPPAGHGARPRR